MNESLSLVIPTYERGDVLLSMLESLLHLDHVPAEVILVDQSSRYAEGIASRLEEWQRAGVIRWLRLPTPSIPRAMNIGLRAARSPIVLFLDDDIVPSSDLLEAHARAHAEDDEIWAVAGQVLQPGEVPRQRNGHSRPAGLAADLDFPFCSVERGWVSNVMAGNLSVKRDRALQVGGFDENFRGVAYRFETEFARRLVAARGRILFEPTASIRHLRASRGGTRLAGSHLTSASPAHGMGDYYFALRSGLSVETAEYILRRPFREVATRFHLRHPWYIPVKLLGELRAFGAALQAAARGPQLLQVDDDQRAPHPAAASVPPSIEPPCRSASVS